MVFPSLKKSLFAIALAIGIVAAVISSSEHDVSVALNNEEFVAGSVESDRRSAASISVGGADNPVTLDDQFFELRSLNISWRQPSDLETLIPPYGPSYEYYRSRALDGDVDAAFILYNILDECADAIEEEDEMKSAINQFRQTHTLKLPSWEKPLRIRSTENLEAMVDRIETSFQTCFPISAEQKAEKMRWLELSAEGGSLLGMIWYAGVVDDSEKSMNAAMAAWKSGSAQSLPIIARRFNENYSTGADSAGNIKAFAALYSYAFLLTESRRSNSDFRVIQIMEKLEEAKRLLHAYQIAEGTKIAREMIENNGQCCFRL